MQDSEVLLVLTTLPPTADADALARDLVESGLAACVTQLPPARSVYRWKGQTETADELPLWIKTTAAAYPALEARLQETHPYTLPEIVAIPVVHGLPDYLAWVAQACAVRPV